MEIPILEKGFVSSLSVGKNQLTTGFSNGTILIVNVGDREFDQLSRKDDEGDELKRLILLKNPQFKSIFQEKPNIFTSCDGYI